MNTLYIIVHKGDASWMIGQKLDGMNNHAIKFKLYEVDNVRHALSCNAAQVALKVNKDGIMEAFNPFIPA